MDLVSGCVLRCAASTKSSCLKRICNAAFRGPRRGAYLCPNWAAELIQRSAQSTKLK